MNDVENVGSISSGTQTVYDDDQTGGEWNANPVYVRSTANTASAAAAQGPTNYVELTGLSPTNGTITITHSFAQRVGSDTVSINGFQLVQVPEPASIGLIGLGIVGLFARRRV